MRIGRNALIAAVALSGLLIFGNSSIADQTVKNTLPYSNGESLICSIAINQSSKYTAALFTPIDDRTWIGWLWFTGYTMEPVRFNVEKSDIDGIKFVGSYGPFDIRVYVSAANQHISVVRAVNDASESVYGQGYCGMLDEDDYAIDVDRSIPE